MNYYTEGKYLRIMFALKTDQKRPPASDMIIISLHRIQTVATQTSPLFVPIGTQ